MSARYTEAAVQVSHNDRLHSWFKLKERSARDWKVRSTKVDAGDFKHELLNRLRSTMAVNVLIKWQAMDCMDSSGFLIWALWFFSSYSVHDGSKYENWKLYFIPVHCHCCHGLSRCQNWNFAVTVTYYLFMFKMSFNNTLLSSWNNGHL